MRRMGIFSSFGMLLALGCQGSTPMADPFGTYGPSRIPPPATGSAGRTDPYYRRPLASNPADQTPRLSSLPAVPQSQFRSNQPASNEGAGLDSGYRYQDTVPPPNDRRLDWRSPVEGQYSSYEAMVNEPIQPRPRFTTATSNNGYNAGMPMELDSRSVQTATPMSPSTPSLSSGGWQASGRY